MNEKVFVSEKGFVSKKNLSRTWNRLFGKVLNSKEEIEANTSENMIAGAEAVKEVYSSLVSDIYVGEDKKLHKVIGGADTVLPFSSGCILIPTWYAILNGGNTYIAFDTTDYTSISIKSWITSPSTRQIQGSDNGEDWEIIYTLPNIVNPISNLDISNYKYVRLYFGNRTAISNTEFAIGIVIR